MTYTQQPADIEMFSGLRHDAFVGSDYECHGVNSMRAGQHVFYKTFMTRNINEAYAYVTKIKISKTQIDSDTATLLFRKAIRVLAGQGLDERTLTVIYVAGCADDDGRHRAAVRCQVSGDGCQVSALYPSCQGVA